MIGRFGTTELLLIAGLVLLVFGPKKLPEIGHAVGKGLKEFRQATRDMTGTITRDEDDVKEIENR